MKICAISPLVSSTKTEILKFISSLDHDLIVLPGKSTNHPGYKAVSNRLKNNSYAFVESGSGKMASVPWLVTKEEYRAMPPQIFAVSPTASDLDQLQQAWSKRTHKISNRYVSFAICGEIDAFKKDGTVKMGRELPYDILINPTHTTRGSWNHLGEKLRNLSKDTVVVHVANNNYDHHDVTTHLRIYVNQEIIPVMRNGNIAYSECEI